MKKPWILFILVAAILVTGCPNTTSHSRAVFMLLDTSGTYQHEIQKAQSIVNYLLGTLESGDSLYVARIDSASFSEKDIIAKMTFAARPSVATRQKRLFKKKFDEFVTSSKRSDHTDITGGVIQAIEYLNATEAGKKYILIFSDLKQETVEGYKRDDIKLEMPGFKVFALNVIKLRTDNIDPREYYDRVETWRKRVEAGGGTWEMFNDLERLDSKFGE